MKNTFVSVYSVLSLLEIVDFTLFILRNRSSFWCGEYLQEEPHFEYLGCELTSVNSHNFIMCSLVSISGLCLDSIKSAIWHSILERPVSFLSVFSFVSPFVIWPDVMFLFLLLLMHLPWRLLKYPRKHRCVISIFSYDIWAFKFIYATVILICIIDVILKWTMWNTTVG